MKFFKLLVLFLQLALGVSICSDYAINVMLENLSTQFAPINLLLVIVISVCIMENSKPFLWLALVCSITICLIISYFMWLYSVNSYTIVAVIELLTFLYISLQLNRPSIRSWMN